MAARTFGRADLSYAPISKSRFVVASSCARRLWLETHKREDASAAKGNGIDSGNAVGALARQLRPEGRLIGHGENFAQALEETQVALSQDEDLTLFEPAFSAGGMAARCDILERRAGRYSLTEVKASTSIKSHHSVDLSFQAGVLRAVGIPVAHAYLQLINRDFVYQRPKHPEFSQTVFSEVSRRLQGDAHTFGKIEQWRSVCVPAER